MELKQLQRRLGMTFIYVTHDQEEALTMSDRIAVMKGGQIDQLAPPVEIYNRPRTRFVADFIGDTNLLSGEVDGEHLTVDGAKIPLHESAGVKAGEKAYLSIRPEMVTVHTGGKTPEDGARPSLEGTVEETIFVGSVWKTIVRLPRRIEDRGLGAALVPRLHRAGDGGVGGLGGRARGALAGVSEASISSLPVGREDIWPRLIVPSCDTRSSRSPSAWPDRRAPRPGWRPSAGRPFPS